MTNRGKYDQNRGNKKGFYLSIITGLVCLMAVGVVYYKMYVPENNKDSGNHLASESVSTPAGSGALNSGKASEQNSEESAIKDVLAQDQVDNDAAEKKSAVKKESSQNKKTKKEKKAADSSKNANADSSVETMSNTGAQSLSFNEEAGLLWPVQGDVILKYSMNNTVYFKTLAQYRCNPAIEIAAKEGTKVSAAADGVVTGITENEETGKMITMDIGNDYSVVYGQMKNIKVEKGQSVKEGDTLGSVAEPTKYFAEEGSNLYFQVNQKEETVDPLLLLR